MVASSVRWRPGRRPRVVASRVNRSSRRDARFAGERWDIRAAASSNAKREAVEAPTDLHDRSAVALIDLEARASLARLGGRTTSPLRRRRRRRRRAPAVVRGRRSARQRCREVPGWWPAAARRHSRAAHGRRVPQLRRARARSCPGSSASTSCAVVRPDRRADRGPAAPPVTGAHVDPSSSRDDIEDITGARSDGQVTEHDFLVRLPILTERHGQPCLARAPTPVKVTRR